MESVLFCSKYYPGAVPFGSATRMERVLRWFRKQEIPVHYLHLVHQSSHQAPPPSLAELVNSQHELPLAGEQALRTHPAQWRSLTRHKRNLLRRLVAQPWARWTTRTTIKRLLRQTQATILWIDHTYVAPLADLLPTDGNLLRIVDTHDVLHLRDESFRAGGLPIKRPISPDDERQLLERFDLVVAIQPDD
ncbi:MAG: hypothetical protein SFU86_09415, partial [Pirellulaceae bacterium]|nr:hypothetical protein [Pirellulaceae bacterium]